MQPLQSYTLPTSYTVKRLRESDFALDTRDKICLYVDNCTLVLFYTESPESKNLLNIFTTISAAPSQMVHFAACNVMLERRVADIIMEIKNMKDHPFSWMGDKGFPLVVVYRRGFPIYYYDGPPNLEMLTFFVSNFACNPNFHSHNFQLLENIKRDMWRDFNMRNPLVIGGNNSNIKPPLTLSAIPYYNK